MTPQKEPEEHEDLQRLFDRTAAEAARPTLTKLAARAAEIPERVLRKSPFLPRWAWGPACAGAAVALVGVLALRATTRNATLSRGSALSSAAPVVSVAIAAASTAEPPRATPRAASDEASDGPELLGDADEGARFDVSGPEADHDLDAWLAATKELSGGT